MHNAKLLKIKQDVEKIANQKLKMIYFSVNKFFTEISTDIKFTVDSFQDYRIKPQNEY